MADSFGNDAVDEPPASALGRFKLIGIYDGEGAMAILMADAAISEVCVGPNSERPLNPTPSFHKTRMQRGSRAMVDRQTGTRTGTIASCMRTR